MDITCPQCGFCRELAPHRIPARPVVATCPKCGCRFRFSAGEGVLETLTPASPAPAAAPAAPASSGPTPAAPAGDDPLPPGAIIPGQEGSPGTPDAESRPDSGPASTPDSNTSNGDASGQDLRQTARQAYAREAERMEDSPQGSGNDPNDETAPPAYGEAASAGLPPWQTAPGRDGWLACFYQTVLLVLFGAQRFFAGLDPRAPQMRALSFFLIVCVIQITAEYFWMDQLIAFLQTESADPELQGLAALFSERESLPLAVLFQTAVQVVKLYAFSALLYLAYRFIAPDRTSFPLVFQILAYSTAPALLSVIPVLGTVAGLFWGLACLLVGCRAAMKLNWQQTLVGVLPLCLVVTSMLMQVLGGLGG